MANTRQTHAGAEVRTDIPRGSWVDRWLPKAARPCARLMRLDRPIGTWLLLFPCWWGLALAAGSLPIPPEVPDMPAARGEAYFVSSLFGSVVIYALLFAIGAVVMRGAGCTYNDIVDRDFDAKVARTALRPIPSGQISVHAALVFLVVQLLLGLMILLQFNSLTVWLGFASLALVFTYPLMKRITYWPQAVLGLTFNWGALVGWSAVTGRLDWPPILLYAGGVAWTLHYDTIYAHQDKEDDALIGVKSTALKFGAATKPWLWTFTAATVLLFGAAIASAGLHWIAWIGLAAVAGHLAWQIRAVDLDDPRDCLAKFHANRWIGWALLLGLFFGGMGIRGYQMGLLL